MRIAVYAGTFDPMTYGHMSVIKRVAGLFERLIVLVAINPEKRPLFTPLERVEIIRVSVECISNVSVDSTSDWVANYAHTAGAQWLVRGVRGATDMKNEHELALLNQQVAPDVTTLFVPAEAGLSDVSSSALKHLAATGQPLERHCPPHVAVALTRRLRRSDRANAESHHAT